MIEQDNLSVDIIKSSPLTRETTPGIGLTPDEQYQEIREDIIDKRERQLRIDQYCLSEQDFDDSHSSYFQKEAARVDAEWRKTPEQVEHEVQRDVMAEIFRRNSPPKTETIIFEESTQVA